LLSFYCKNCFANFLDEDAYDDDYDVQIAFEARLNLWNCLRVQLVSARNVVSRTFFKGVY